MASIGAQHLGPYKALTFTGIPVSQLKPLKFESRLKILFLISSKASMGLSESTSFPDGNFVEDQLLGGSICLSPLY